MTELLLVVTLAGQRVAIPAEQVEAVVEIDALTPVPRAADHIAGLAALRSRVLTVIDCAASIGLGRSPARGLCEAVLVEADGHPYALLVDRVEDVVELSGEISPVRTALGDGWRRAAVGMVVAGEDLLLVIDATALIAGPAAQAA
ncbi:MAG TPA: chemotaxis protein CheW [Allosphingosinicella sp.]|nr:chemotaxis protein CheW [Allosphingosinicella sp.]